MLNESHDLDTRLSLKTTVFIKTLGLSDVNTDSLSSYSNCRQCLIYLLRYAGFRVGTLQQAHSLLLFFCYPGPLSKFFEADSNHLKLSVMWLAELIRLAREVCNFSMSNLCKKELEVITAGRTVRANKLDHGILEQIVNFVSANRALEPDPVRCKQYSSQEVTVFSHDYLFVLGMLFRGMRDRNSEELGEREKKAVFAFSRYLLRCYIMQFRECIEREKLEFEGAGTLSVEKSREELAELESAKQEYENVCSRFSEDLDNLANTVDAFEKSIAETKAQAEELKLRQCALEETKQKLAEEHRQRVAEDTKQRNLARHHETIVAALSELRGSLAQLAEAKTRLAEELKQATEEAQEVKAACCAKYQVIRSALHSNSLVTNERIKKLFANDSLFKSEVTESINSTVLNQITNFRELLNSELDSMELQKQNATRRIAFARNEINRYKEQIDEHLEEQKKFEASFNEEWKELNVKLDRVRSNVNVVQAKIRFIEARRAKAKQSFAEKRKALTAEVGALGDELRERAAQHAELVAELRERARLKREAIVGGVRVWESERKPFMNDLLQSAWTQMLQPIEYLLNNEHVSEASYSVYAEDALPAESGGADAEPAPASERFAPKTSVEHVMQRLFSVFDS